MEGDHLMRIRTYIYLYLLLILLQIPFIIFAADKHYDYLKDVDIDKEESAISAWWSFNKIKNNYGYEEIQQTNDSTNGYFIAVEGISGNALKFDGYTTYIKRKAINGPKLDTAFTIQAWVALQTYPWNWTAIINQEKQKKSGFFFGINAEGHLGLNVVIDGQWIICQSEEILPLLKWTHIAGTFNNKDGLKIYINGETVGLAATSGKIDMAQDMEILIGKSYQKMSPKYILQDRGLLSNMIFDGLMDELKIYKRALSEAEIKQTYNALKPANAQPLQFRAMPTGPVGKGKFGAHYCRLEYDTQWDKLWRTGAYSDILIRFDLLPVNLLFWRGTNYGAVWVTENGLLMGDQSVERAGPGKSVWGCPEHMSDKQCRYSSVRIIENNAARIVLHWRYALADVKYIIFGEDPETNWGEWAEEYYTIYPDGVATRKQVLWSHHLSHEWQETIVLHQPGTRPEDNIELEALTVANMEGESNTYSWAHHPGRIFVEPEDANIQITNLKSEFRPFLILEPKAGIKLVAGPADKERSYFTWWNHWPIAQLPSDGTNAIAPDRPSHSSLSQSIEESPVIKHDPMNNTFTAVSLIGITEKPIKELVPLARSWNDPAALNIPGKGFTYEGYDIYQRAYVLNSNQNKDQNILNFELAASKKSPIVNPCFVIKNWGFSEVELVLNGKKIKEGDTFRFGYKNEINRTDLIVWILLSDNKPLMLSITPH
jgi:hypothetical protein